MQREGGKEGGKKRRQEAFHDDGQWKVGRGRRGMAWWRELGKPEAVGLVMIGWVGGKGWG